MAGYREPTITLTYPELGDDVEVVIRNPRIALHYSDLSASAGEGAIERNIAKAKHLIGRLIVSWRMYDIDSGAPLSMPSEDPTVLDRCPEWVLMLVLQEIDRLAVPTRASTAT